jgi:hypothetical protein
VPNYAIRVRTGRSLTRDALVAAGRVVAPRHPALRAVEFDVRVADEWIPEAERELATRFDADRGLVRLVLAGEDLVLTGDHGASDGLSGVVLLRELFIALDDPDRLPPPSGQPPAVRDLVPDGELPPPRPPGGRDWWAGPLPEVRSTTATLDPEQTERLREHARAAGVRVHAALCGAWLRALTLAEPARTERTVSTPVSVRGLLPADRRDAVGLYLTTVRLNVDADPERDLWDQARELQAQLTRETAAEVLRDRLAASLRRFGFGDGPPSVDYDLSLTNLGVLPLPAAGPMPVVEASGPLVNALPGERTVGVCTVAGSLQFAFTCFADDLDTEEARSLLGTAVAELVT